MTMESQNWFKQQTRSLSKIFQPSWLIVAVIMLLVALVVPMAAMGSRIALLALAAPVGLIGVYFIQSQPGFIFPLAIIISLLVPFSIGTGTESGINASVLWAVFVIGLWLAYMIVEKKNIQLVDSPTIAPLLAWFLVSILAFGFGQLDWLPLSQAPMRAQLGQLAIFVLLPGLFLLALHRIRELWPIKWMTWSLLAIGSVFVVGLILRVDTQILQRVFQRAVFDSMFWTWMIALAFSQSVFNDDLSKGWRLVIGLSGLGAFYFTWVLRQSWISGWMPGLLAILVMVAIKRPRLVIAAGIIGLVVLVAGTGLFGDIFLSGDNEYSLSTRLEAWRIVLDLVKFNPILGLGPANYYSYTLLHPILGYTVSFNSHNNYIDILAQSGILGLATFSWFLWAAGRELWNLRLKVSDGFSRAFVYGAIGGFVGVVVSGGLGDWILPFVYNVGLAGFRASSIGWLMLGAALSMNYFLPAKSSEVG